MKKLVLVIVAFVMTVAAFGRVASVPSVVSTISANASFAMSPPAGWNPAEPAIRGVPDGLLPAVPTGVIEGRNFPERISSRSQQEINAFMSSSYNYIMRTWEDANFHLTDNAQRAYSLLERFIGVYQRPDIIRDANGNALTVLQGGTIPTDRGAWRDRSFHYSNGLLFHWGFGAVQTLAVEMYRVNRHSDTAREFLLHTMRDIDHYLIRSRSYGMNPSPASRERLDPLAWMTGEEWTNHQPVWEANREARLQMWRQSNPGSNDNDFSRCPIFYAPPVNNFVSDELIRISRDEMDIRITPAGLGTTFRTATIRPDGRYLGNGNASYFTNVSVPVALRPIFPIMDTPAIVWGSNTWGTDPYYDDVIWTVKAMLDGGKLLDMPEFIHQAEMGFRYVLTGWTSWAGGGILWQEDHHSKNACINGPTAVAATMFYDFYYNLPIGSLMPNGEVLTPEIRQRKLDFYLGWAIAIYDWTNDFMRTESGLYYDNIYKGVGRTINIQRNPGWIFTYNTGTFLSASTHLYRITGEQRFREDAFQTMETSYYVFMRRGNAQGAGNIDAFNQRFPGVAPYVYFMRSSSTGGLNSPHMWFNMYLVKGWADFGRQFNTTQYMHTIRRTMDFAWLYARDDFGFVTMDQRGLNTSVGQTWGMEVLHAAATIEIYCLIAAFFADYDTVNRDALNARIAYAQSITQSNYTPATWVLLQERINNAISVRDNPASTQSQVNMATGLLNNGITGLREIADTTALNQRIIYAQGLIEADFMPHVWEAVRERLRTAIEIRDDINSTQEEVDAAKQNLDNAILAIGIIDMDALGAAITKANALNESDWTVQSWAVMQEALTEAILVRYAIGTTQETADNAARTLTQAIDALEAVRAESGCGNGNIVLGLLGLLALAGVVFVIKKD